MIKYKGYTGTVDVDFEDGVLHGHVLHLRDIITFEGNTVQEIEQAFRDSVDDYLEFCQELGKAPEKPFSGHFTVRIAPDLHQRITLEATRRRMSLNQWVGEVFEEGLQGTEELMKEQAKKRLLRDLEEKEKERRREKKEKKQAAAQKAAAQKAVAPKAPRSTRRKTE